jgi:stage II sporulation protein E
MGLGIAAGRASLGGLALFTVPMAVTAAFMAMPLDWAVAAGLAAGVCVHAGSGLLPVLGGALAVLVAFLTTRSLRERWAQPLPAAALIAGGVNILVRGIFLVHQSEPAAILGLLSESVLAGLFTPVALYGFTGLLRVRERQKELRALLILVFVMCGLGDLYIGPVALREILARFVLITVAYAWGAGWGAAAGVILGLLGGNLQIVLPQIGFYAGTGFFTGVMRFFGRTGVIVGFFLASLLFSVFYSGPGAVSGHLLASLIAAGSFFLASPLVKRWLGQEKSSIVAQLPLEAEIGFSQRSKATESFCGDSFAVAHQPPGHLLLTISDGMGSGVNAMRESRIVVKLLEQIMNNGTSPETAAGIINTALYLRGGEECAASIDLTAVDLDGRYVDILKAGAPPSFLKRGCSVEMIRSSCWPAGVLDRLETDVHRRQVLPGDMLVMASDGVTEIDQEASLPDNWLYDFLRDLSLDDAQAVADLVLKHALKAAGLQNRDDMTVLVARFADGPELQ